MSEGLNRQPSSLDSQIARKIAREVGPERREFKDQLKLLEGRIKNMKRIVLNSDQYKEYNSLEEGKYDELKPTDPLRLYMDGYASALFTYESSQQMLEIPRDGARVTATVFQIKKHQIESLQAAIDFCDSIGA